MDSSKVLIESIEDAGIEYIFGLPGSVIMNTIDKIVGTDIDFIATRHEQTATTMADGYARVTGRPGVTLAHVGPGVANQVIGLGAAYRDNSPVVAIGGNEDLERLGRNIWHEWDVESVLDPVTKWTTRLEQSDDAARTIRNALLKSVTGTPGPTFIDLPKDVSRTESSYPESDRQFYDQHELRVPVDRPSPDPEKINRVVNLLQEAQRPLLLTGGGCVWSDASEVCQDVVEHLGIPIATTESGRGIVPESHPNSLGLIGTRGTDAANEAVASADAVLAVGARFSDTTTDDWTIINADDTTIIQVDITQDEFAFQYPVDEMITADARLFLQQLKTALPRECGSSWEKEALEEAQRAINAEIEAFFEYDESEQIGASQFFSVLRDERDDDAIITQGGGVHATFNQKLSSMDQYSHLHAISFGAMGYGFPMAMGAKLGAPDRQVICVEGDGGFAMVMQELETAVRYDIDVNVIIYDNYSHGTQKLRQARLFGERYLGTDFDNPNFAHIADDFGAFGKRVEAPDNLRSAMRETFDHDGPSLLDVVVDPKDWPATDSIAQI